MDNQPFEKLAEQAASGLKGDQELYLDVKQELRTHLEEKAEQFSREGNSEEESADLARKSFGSPLDVAADLLNANKRRMKLRALFRLAFGALIVPVAILLALYVGYGRFARLTATADAIVGSRSGPHFATLPLFGVPDWSRNARKALIGMGGAEDRLQYWQARKSEPDSREYYAYYAIRLETDDERQYAETMRLGEQIEPQNALYNVLLADWYLKRGISAKLDKPKDTPGRTDDILNRRYFDLGVAELMRATHKPYLQTYQQAVMRKKLDALPRPLFTEDYILRLNVQAAELFPHLARYRELSRKIPGCARVLLSEGEKAKAGAVIDTWRPYVNLLMDDKTVTLIHSLVITASATVLTREAPEVYTALGEPAKAQDADRAYKELVALRDSLRNAPGDVRAKTQKLMDLHAPSFAGSILLPVFGGRAWVTKAELAPSRMHEYVIAEEIAFNGFMVILVLAMIGSLLQGVFWLLKLRKADAAPLLLAPPSRVILKGLLLGVLLPLVVYWVYSRIPALSGREYNIHVNAIRFWIEMLVVLLVMFWVPVTIVRRYIRVRCADLEVPLPEPRTEAVAEWTVRGTAITLFILAAIAQYVPKDDQYYPVWMMLLTGAAIATLGYALFFANSQRKQHGLYFGTVARSLATVYAFSILLMAVVVQPWMLYNEVKLLRQDKLMYGQLASRKAVSFTLAEDRATDHYNAELRKILQGK